MAFVPVYAALALLQTYRVTGKIPVDDGMTVDVEVQSFLADRR
jgi:hypothetical protein